MNLSTQLRYVSSKDVDKLIIWVNKLPYKIEIKGQPILKNNKFYLFYVLPENQLAKEILGGDLD